MKTFIKKNRRYPASRPFHSHQPPAFCPEFAVQAKEVRRTLRRSTLKRNPTALSHNNYDQQTEQRIIRKPLSIAATPSPHLQRREEPDPAAVKSASSSQAAPGREPYPDERRQWGDYFPNMADFRILKAPSYGFNCFAWALGIEDRSITSNTIIEAGYSPNLEGWTGYLTTEHGFGRYADGPADSADLVLFGEGEGAILHAARKAARPFGAMNYSSKLGDFGKTPVILHALLDIQGQAYGTALRSFWKAAETNVSTEG